MEKKKFHSNSNFKLLDKEGSFKAVFSRFNVIDLDGDVTLPGAFKEGQKVKISFWGHRWSDLPVGRGTIHSDDEKAWVEGQFFLDTDVGRETYKTVKNLGELQEWSYGFDINESDMGQFQGEKVQFLKDLTVYEVAPVFRGAGIGTGTTEIKALNELEKRIRKIEKHYKQDYEEMDDAKPAPRDGENEEEFIARCIPIVLEEGTAETQEQAAAICYSYWEERKNKLGDSSKDNEDEDEGEAGNSKPSGFTPEVIRVFTQLDLD